MNDHVNTKKPQNLSESVKAVLRRKFIGKNTGIQIKDLKSTTSGRTVCGTATVEKTGDYHTPWQFHSRGRCKHKGPRAGPEHEKDPVCRVLFPAANG